VVLSAVICLAQHPVIESYTFKASSAPAIQAPSNLKITNVVPGDFNYDGRLDLLVMSQANPNGGWWSDDEVLNMHFYKGLGESTFGGQALSTQHISI